MTEDSRTNTVEGAEEFEKMRHGQDEIDSGVDYYDYEEEEEEEEEEDCNCSDPGCPCGGRKRGGL